MCLECFYLIYLCLVFCIYFHLFLYCHLHCIVWTETNKGLTLTPETRCCQGFSVREVLSGHPAARVRASTSSFQYQRKFLVEPEGWTKSSCWMRFAPPAKRSMGNTPRKLTSLWKLHAKCCTLGCLEWAVVLQCIDSWVVLMPLWTTVYVTADPRVIGAKDTICSSALVTTSAVSHCPGE